MDINLRLNWLIDKNGRLPSNGKYQKICIPEKYTVEDIIKQFNIPIEAVSIIVLNGSLVKKETILQENDVLDLYPPIEGG